MDYFNDMPSWLTPATIASIVYTVFRFLRVRDTNKTRVKIAEINAQRNPDTSNHKSKFQKNEEAT
jgi:hypothetical protein